jgi:four helix bundle protein
VAQGSLTEVQNQLIISKDLGYISEDKYKQFKEQTVLVHKLLTGLIKSLNRA